MGASGAGMNAVIVMVPDVRNAVFVMAKAIVSFQFMVKMYVMFAVRRMM